MLDNNTVQKLHEMKLSVMAAAFQKQLADQAFAGMSFEERFGLIVDAEWASRKSNRLTRLIRRAAFDTPGACLEDVDYRPGRDLDKGPHRPPGHLQLHRGPPQHHTPWCFRQRQNVVCLRLRQRRLPQLLHRALHSPT